jgi:hypothetical protein
MQISEEKAKAAEIALMQAESDSAAVQMSDTGHTKLKAAHMQTILQLAADGKTQQEIASVIGCNQATISRFLRSVADPQELVQKLMRGGSLDVLRQWKRATSVASKRGDHRPSREWIEAAYPELRPQQGNSAGGGGVTINIGMPGSPIALPTIDITPTRATLSPAVSDDLHRLNPSNTET